MTYTVWKCKWTSHPAPLHHHTPKNINTHGPWRALTPWMRAMNESNFEFVDLPLSHSSKYLQDYVKTVKICLIKMIRCRCITLCSEFGCFFQSHPFLVKLVMFLFTALPSPSKFPNNSKNIHNVCFFNHGVKHHSYDIWLLEQGGSVYPWLSENKPWLASRSWRRARWSS